MINLFYDNEIKINGQSPVVRKFPVLPNHLKRLQIPFFESYIGDAVSNGLNLYVIELCEIQHDIEDIFRSIPDSTLNFIRNNNLKILFFYPREGFDLTLYNNWFKTLHLLFVKYQLQNIKKYFIYNNLYIEKYYKKFIADNLDCKDVKFEKVFEYSFFHSDSYFKIIENNIKLNSNSTPKSKNFVCYNAQLRPHRVFLVSELLRRNLSNDSYVSMIGDNKNFVTNDIENSKKLLEEYFLTVELDSDMVDHCRSYVNNWHPMLLDKDKSTVDVVTFDLRHYQDTFFSVVTETGMGYPTRVTEKTFKPIANRHPFLIVGCSGTLKYLQSLGYQTFPEIFDESYDDIEDVSTRLLSVIDQIEKFCLLTETEKNIKFNLIIDKLEHNYNLFMNVHAATHSDEFKQILTQIQND